MVGTPLEFLPTTSPFSASWMSLKKSAVIVSPEALSLSVFVAIDLPSAQMSCFPILFSIEVQSF